MKSLDVVASILSKRKIDFVRIDGSCSKTSRQNAFSRFQDDAAVTILLMTLGTGAVGYISKIMTLITTTDLVHGRLNLTKASRLHILEPQWNPSIEAQAIGRVFRLGQKKNVVITRYIVRNTVEEVRDPIPPNLSAIYKALLTRYFAVHSFPAD